MQLRSITICAAVLLLAGCNNAKQEPFWLGADISWETQMEQRGQNFYNYTGDEEWECTALMKDLGLNAVRLRVWVDPQAWTLQQQEQRRQMMEQMMQAQAQGQGPRRPRNVNGPNQPMPPMPPQPQAEPEEPADPHAGSCDKEDLLVKCLRAKELGMEIMVDFHYSDNWADPGKQPVPLSWKGHSYEQMKEDLKAHTVEVLQLLKDNGVEPKWVQVGNETSNGLLWSRKAGRFGPGQNAPAYEDTIGLADRCPANYAGFIQAGHEAVKSVFPACTTIVHLDNGWKPELYDWNLGILEENGVEYDMVGMSLYPYWARSSGREDADQVITDCIANIKHVYERFGKESMIVETGFEVDESKPEVLEEGRRQLARVIRESIHNTDGHCKGVFYWEPECRPQAYKLGAFTVEGRPTVIMEAYKDYETL